LAHQEAAVREALATTVLRSGSSTLTALSP